MVSGKTGVYIFQKIEPSSNVWDMFFATVHGVGYTDEVKFKLPERQKSLFFP
jgi:hypothetical protein